MEEKRELAKQEYINTPFAYLKLQTGLSLLQQDIMTRVSAHLQKYFNEYWSDNELRFSKENPRTFLTDEQIENLGPIRINFSEIRISPDSYERLDEARNKIMDIKIKGLVETEGGKKDRKWNVFSYVDLPVTDSGTTVMKKDRKVDESGKVHKVGEAKKTETDRYRGYMEVYLDKDLIKHTFNMISGYVTHPEKIAQIGRVPNMPSMYYFIRHRMNNFRPDKDGKEITTATISIEDLREHLAMYIRDAKGEIIKVKYPKYSRFKSQVLTVILDEIKRCFDKGLIDAYFEMSEIRPRGKKTGEPTSITFTKIDHTEDTEEIKEETATEPTPTQKRTARKAAAKQTELQFSDEPQQEVKPSGMSWLDVEIDKKKRKEMDCWLSFLLHYNGKAKDLLTMTQFHGFIKDNEGNDLLVLSYADDFEDKWRNLKLTREETIETWKEFMTHFKGIKFKGIRRYVPKN